ncbi:MAG: O-antigen ligase family protein, partial [Lentisphaeria bacterium]|nr:O-antigen ligase family protein [Lentisphaeria bacterium]
IGLDGRWVVWGETMELMRRFPLAGIGLDAFERVSPLVESGFSAGKVSFHAHNDYLELLAEVGLPLGILALLLLLGGLARLLWRVCRCRDALHRTLGVAAWCGLLAIALHEGVDYCLRAPANAFLAVALAVLCLLAGEVGGRNEPRMHTKEHEGDLVLAQRRRERRGGEVCPRSTRRDTKGRAEG